MEFDSTVPNSTGIVFFWVNESTIKGCVFNGETTGILDAHSQGGNSYISDTFTNILLPLDGGKPSVPLTIGHYEYGEAN